MSARENPPFPLGATFFAGDTTQIETTGAQAQQLEGMEWDFEDLDYSQTIGAAPNRTKRTKRCRVVRNTSGGALLPKALVTFDLTGVGPNGANDPGVYGARAVGKSSAAGDIAYPVDEFLPAAGVANNDLFWITVKGPAKVTLDNVATPGIAIGDAINPSAVGGGQAGMAAKQAPSVATGAANAAQLQGQIGRAMTSSNVASTDIVVDIGQR